ncbi:exodeoxyribonuclease VII large subunit [Clostridium subterminale]|uniref:Exodeoxyribonuclease 7 large subunit n=1 Tax=Clostridium subterminale TaxID=1550 RepID=A0ABP3VVP3_CLOSU
MYSKILTVTAVNSYIKKVIDNDFILKNSNIKGELSNVKIHSSGHIYFSLKDNFTKLKCVMFKTKAMNLTFMPKDGMNVVVSGNISIYEKEGTYQLYCNTMEVDGEGELFTAFNLLKEKLEREGLFDINRKKEIPVIPRRIGVITSPTGAAVRDIIKVATRRNENIDILIYPSLVQGINASKDISRGIGILNNIEDIDVIILARGGGSIEELWAFNEEEVARAIATSKTPIITGIGHETDFTIADFTADLRAATPSHAAEIAVYSLEGLKDKLNGLRDEFIYAIDKNINERFNSLDSMFNRLRLYSPENYVVNQYDKLDNLKSKLAFTMELKLQEERNRLKVISHRLIANNPLNILDKGYSIIKSPQNEPIEYLEKLKKHEVIDITMKDGHGLFKIEQVEE